MTTHGILLHVYHLGAKGWEDLMWGDPNTDTFGTLTQFAYTLLTTSTDDQVKSIILSGPSTKDGLTEAAYTKQFLLHKMNELSRFPTLKVTLDALTPTDHDVFTRRVNDLVVGPVIKNTFEEISHASLFFNQNDPPSVVTQIAAASHAPRCLQNQIIVRQNGGIPLHQPWYVLASDTNFIGTTPGDVVILEPPHRGDDPMVQYTPTLANAIKPYFSMDTKDKEKMIQTITELTKSP